MLSTAAGTLLLAIFTPFCIFALLVVKRYLCLAKPALTGFARLHLHRHPDTAPSLPTALDTPTEWLGLRTTGPFLVISDLRIDWRTLSIQIGSVHVLLPLTPAPATPATPATSASLARRAGIALLLRILQHISIGIGHVRMVVFDESSAAPLFFQLSLQEARVQLRAESGASLLEATQIAISDGRCHAHAVLALPGVRATRDPGTGRLGIRTHDACRLGINSTLLLFLASMRKQRPATDAPPAHWLGSCHVPRLHVRLDLPHVLGELRVFEAVECTLTDLAVRTAPPRCVVTCARATVDAVYDAQQVADRIFCPVDQLLQRGPQTLAGQTARIVTAVDAVLGNWSPALNYVSSDICGRWLDSILAGTPDWSMSADAATFARFASTLSFFGADANESVRTSFLRSYQSGQEPSYERSHEPSQQEPSHAHTHPNPNPNTHTPMHAALCVTALDVALPFEFPMANLVDHCVILVKAALQPLSQNTDSGYWAGDGDALFRGTWRIGFHADRTRIAIADDPFELRLCTIARTQAALAESRTRLEAALLQACPASRGRAPAGPDAAAQQRLARALATAPLGDTQVAPLLALHEQLQHRYAASMQAQRSAHVPPLLELLADGLSCSLAWDATWAGGRGSLHRLLNAMEGGALLAPADIADMTTCIGGFAQASARTLQLGLRDFARPVLLAPGCALLGPLVLLEAGVRDPSVLVRYPVRLPGTAGAVHVLRSILPLKLYHCVYASVADAQLCHVAASPNMGGPLAMLDRALDRCVKAAVEDPSPPLPGWDKLRYTLHGCHSRLRVQAPCLVTLAADASPPACTEHLALFFPAGLDLGARPGSRVRLATPGCSLHLHSQHLAPLRAFLQQQPPLWQWDQQGGPARDSLPLIHLTHTDLEIAFAITNTAGAPPVHHWLVRPVARANITPAQAVPRTP